MNIGISGQHHDHMICTKCRSIFEFENQASLNACRGKLPQITASMLLQHRMELVRYLPESALSGVTLRYFTGYGKDPVSAW